MFHFIHLEVQITAITTPFFDWKCFLNMPAMIQRQGHIMKDLHSTYWVVNLPIKLQNPVNITLAWEQNVLIIVLVCISSFHRQLGFFCTKARITSDWSKTDILENGIRPIRTRPMHSSWKSNWKPLAKQDKYCHKPRSVSNPLRTFKEELVV